MGGVGRFFFEWGWTTLVKFCFTRSKLREQPVSAKNLTGKSKNRNARVFGPAPDAVLPLSVVCLTSSWKFPLNFLNGSVRSQDERPPLNISLQHDCSEILFAEIGD